MIKGRCERCGGYLRKEDFEQALDNAVLAGATDWPGCGMAIDCYVCACLDGGEMTYYRQCELAKGDSRQVSWIPEQFAKEGNHVRLHEEDGWKILTVSVARKSDDFVRAHERDHMHHRSRTDV